MDALAWFIAEAQLLWAFGESRVRRSTKVALN
jgi:hypothetical protein